MDNSYPPDAWKRLGHALELRRGQLGYGFGQRGKFVRERAGGRSAKTIARLERGERTNYPPATLAQVEALYEWEPGSIASVLAGGNATPVKVAGNGLTDSQIVQALEMLLRQRQAGGDEENRRPA